MFTLINQESKEKDRINLYIKTSVAKIETHSNNPVIQEMDKKNVRGEIIGKLISSRYFVKKDLKIKELVEALNQNPAISEVVVIDEHNSPRGVIMRKRLFNLLGRPFGKEVLENKQISEFMGDNHLNSLITRVPVFHHDRNIFSVVNELGNTLQTTDIQRYLVVHGEDRFAGVLTNIDILFHLSSITQKDIKTAKRLQDSIVRHTSYEKAENFEVCALSAMAREVGGDFYISREYAPQKWMFSVCDVSGKGVSAALVTAVLGGVFSMYDFHASTSIFIKKLNKYIHDSFQMEKYLTGVFMKFDEKSGQVRLYDMGHSYIYLYRNKTLYKIKTSDENLPIGIMPQCNPKANQLTLREDDILITFTDGITEQTNVSDEEYGLKKLSKIIENHKGKDFENLPRTLFQDITRFRGTEPQHDDVTVFCLHYKGLK
jgi:sigma-B regulation protein RsbU (phosphoserine phosphatase)